ncbi:MAG: pilus assembly PilX N-terminal domain-containing protein, partial [Bacteroidales bacterium]|nr:pilus assembly PilX N-terminal domain-containing protein [Bacteroidales bacterium]
FKEVINMKKKYKKIKDLLSNQKGIALLTVLIFTFLMVTFVVALLAMTGNDIKISAIQRDSTEAFYQAESGIEQALYNLNVSDAYDIIYWRPGQNPPEPYKKLPFNSSEYYEVTITNIGDPGADPPELLTDKIRIISTGILTPVGVENSRKRSVEVIAEIGWNTDVTYKYALLSDKVVLILGSGPDCPKISGDIHSNDAIEVNSQNFDEFYTGIATASGETNDLDETEDGEFTGVDPVDIPPIDYPGLLYSATHGKGNYIVGPKILENGESWVVGSDGPPAVNAGIQYIDGDLIVRNGGVVDIHNGAIVVTGSIEFKEGSELEITKDSSYIDYNDPNTALALVGQGDIILKANSSFIGGIIQSYCPLPDGGFTSGTVELKNDCVVNGAVIAETIFMHNGTEVNYDETNLQKYITQGDPFYKKISWREL